MRIAPRRLASHPLSLRRNFSWTLGGNIVYSACQWGQLIVLAKLLNPEIVGVFALGLAVTGPIMIAANLGLRTLQVTDAKREFTFKYYIWLRVITTLIAILVIVVIAKIGGYSAESTVVMLVIGVGKGLDSIGDVIHGHFQQIERMDSPAKALVLNGAFSLFFMVVGVALTHSVVWAAVASAIGSLITLLAYDIPVVVRFFSHIDERGERQDERTSVFDETKDLTPAMHLRTLFRLARLSFPLGLAYILMSLNPNLPRYIIEHDLGTHELGVFAALAYLMTAGNTVMGALSQAALPRLTDYFNQGRRSSFNRLLLLLLGFAVLAASLAVTGALLFGEQIITLIYRSDYAQNNATTVWLTVSAGLGFAIWFLDNGLAAARRFSIQVPINLAMVGTTLLASLFLIPRHGLEGAAWALSLAFAVQLILKAVVLHQAIQNIPGSQQSRRTLQKRFLGAAPDFTASFDYGGYGGRQKAAGALKAPAMPEAWSLPLGFRQNLTTREMRPITSVMAGRRFLAVDWSSAAFSFVFCGVGVVAFGLSSSDYAHWFIIPIYLCGALIGTDVVSWVRGRMDVLDPVGLLGLFGLHFFFLAPLLHVHWNYWIPYVTPPEDWRPWLGRMAWINFVGLLLYFWGRSIQSSRRVRRANRITEAWTLDSSRLLAFVVPGMIFSFILQVFIYAKSGGIYGYIAAYDSQLQGNGTFKGFGWLFMFSEIFPIFALFTYAVYVQRTGRGRSWKTVGAVLLSFFILKIFFGGLRGSRANYVWPLFWAVGIIHLWVRPISRKVILVGVSFLVLFMYAYGFYKVYGSDAIFAAQGRTLQRQNSAANTPAFAQTLLGDLGRSDVQAFLLYRVMSPNSDYHYGWGRTYLGAASLLIPARVWPERPPTKVKEGTQALFGKQAWSSGPFVASEAYGLTGETLLNFGPLAIPPVFFLFGIVVGGIRRWSRGIGPEDSRRLFVPFVLSLPFFFLIWDSDVILFYIITSGLLPGFAVLLSSKKHQFNADLVSSSGPRFRQGAAGRERTKQESPKGSFINHM